MNDWFVLVGLFFVGFFVVVGLVFCCCFLVLCVCVCVCVCVCEREIWFVSLLYN